MGTCDICKKGAELGGCGFFTFDHCLECCTHPLAWSPVESDRAVEGRGARLREVLRKYVPHANIVWSGNVAALVEDGGALHFIQDDGTITTLVPSHLRERGK